MLSRLLCMKHELPVLDAIRPKCRYVSNPQPGKSKSIDECLDPEPRDFPVPSVLREEIDGPEYFLYLFVGKWQRWQRLPGRGLNGLGRISPHPSGLHAELEERLQTFQLLFC